MPPVHIIVKLLAGALLLGVLASCAAAPNEEIWGTNTKGQRVQLDPAKVCWHTFGSIPDNVEVIADPTADRFVFRKLPDAEANTTDGTTSNVSAPPDDGGGGSGSGSGCTCSCSTGHCSPALIGGSCVCVIQDGCTSCTKS